MEPAIFASAHACVVRFACDGSGTANGEVLPTRLSSAILGTTLPRRSASSPSITVELNRFAVEGRASAFAGVLRSRSAFRALQRRAAGCVSVIPRGCSRDHVRRHRWALAQAAGRRLAIRGMSERTRETYSSAVAAMAKYYGAPEPVGQEEIQRYLLHLLPSASLPRAAATSRQRVSVLLPGHPQANRRPSSRSAAQAAAEAAADPRARGDRAAARGKREPQAPGDADDRLRGGGARLGAVPSQGGRHRLLAHDDPRRAGQGRQGPLHAALRAAARRAAPLLARLPAKALAVRAASATAARSGRSRSSPHSASTARPRPAPASPSTAASTPCATPSPPICWRPA